ncbi:MAG: hypothetical protein VXZ96_05610 [Myxococcota bacterium]|nr:hypothetical protein [Myxococcota bacterium]
MLRFAICCGLFWSLISTAFAQRVDVHVYGAESSQLRLELRWLGEQVEVPLKTIGDAQVGAVDGELIRFLPIRLWVESERTPVPALVFDGIVPIYLSDQSVYIHLGKGQTEARLQSGPGTQSERQWRESLQTLVFALFFGLVFAVVWWVNKAPRGTPIQMRWPWWATPLTLFGLSVAWTWPSVLSGADFFVGRHHDAPGTVWFLGQAHHWTGGLDLSSAWPVGANYQRLDSFLLWPISHLSHFIHPASLHGLLLCFGVFISAWAAAHSAEQFGAKAPWNLLSGITFVGGGVAATVALEGHIYQLINPFMPLLLVYWWRACQPSGTVRQALIAGFYFILCVLTSAYIGISASLIVMVIWCASKGWQRQVTWAALLPVLPAMLVYVIQFFGASETSIEGDAMAVAVSSATLENLLGASDDIDRASHSLSVGLLPLGLALSCLLPRLTSRRSGWPILWMLVAVGLVASMGTHLFLNASGQVAPLPLLLLRQLPGFSLLDFPLRLSWAIFLGLGVMSALAMTQLAKRGNSRLWLLLCVALLEPILLTRLPSRQRLQSAKAPSAMMQVEGPILSIYPESLSFGYEYDPDLFFTSLSCLFQVSHQQPIADNCVSVDVSHQPRAVLGKWVHQRLMAGEGHAVRTALSQLGFSALAFHPDLYSEGDSIRLRAGLSTLHSEPSESKDAGLWTQVYPLDGGGNRPTNWTPLPSPVVSFWGAQTETASLKRLLVGLMPEYPEFDYQLTVQSDNKTLGTIPFRDLLQGAVQAISDGRLYAEWTVPVDSPLYLTVSDTHGTVYWQGQFKPASSADFLFIGLPEGPKPLVPTVISPPLNPMGGFFAVLGWLMIGGLGFGLVRANRRM